MGSIWFTSQKELEYYQAKKQHLLDMWLERLKECSSLLKIAVPRYTRCRCGDIATVGYLAPGDNLFMCNRCEKFFKDFGIELTDFFAPMYKDMMEKGSYPW
jgi:hypothetical protein